jgi:hypothetical protein
MRALFIMSSFLLALSAAGHAQTAPAASAPRVTQETVIQRNVNQEKRIGQGLESGALSTREAAHLQREEAAVNRMESRAMKDGELSTQEKARITRAQNNVSQDIHAAKHNGVQGNPDAASSQRLQADVQRSVKQQERIQQGVQSGSLTTREAARLQAGQARTATKQARAGRDGHVGAVEQARIQHGENHQSRRIRREKHDAQAEPAAK